MKREYETLYLVLAYPKSIKDTLSSAEINELRKIAGNIKKNLQKQKRR